MELLASVIPTKGKPSGVFLILTDFGKKNIWMIDKTSIKHLGFEPGVLLYLKLHEVAAHMLTAYRKSPETKHLFSPWAVPYTHERWACIGCKWSQAGFPTCLLQQPCSFNTATLGAVERGAWPDLPHYHQDVFILASYLRLNPQMSWNNLKIKSCGATVRA